MLTSIPKFEGSTPADSTVVRERLVEALNLDLIGPGAGHALASERLPGWVRPSNWYLAGLLVPASSPCSCVNRSLPAPRQSDFQRD